MLPWVQGKAGPLDGKVLAHRNGAVIVWLFPIRQALQGRPQVSRKPVSQCLSPIHSTADQIPALAAVVVPSEDEAVEAIAYGVDGHPWKAVDPGKEVEGLGQVGWSFRRRAVAEYRSVSLWRSALLTLLVMDLAIVGIAVGSLLGYWDPLSK